MYVLLQTVCIYISHSVIFITFKFDKYLEDQSVKSFCKLLGLIRQ